MPMGIGTRAAWVVGTAMVLGCSGLTGFEFHDDVALQQWAGGDGDLIGSFSIGQSAEAVASAGLPGFKLNRNTEGILYFDRGALQVESLELGFDDAGKLVSADHTVTVDKEDMANDLALRMFIDGLRTQASKQHPDTFQCGKDISSCEWLDREQGVAHSSHWMYRNQDREPRWLHSWEAQAAPQPKVAGDAVLEVLLPSVGTDRLAHFQRRGQEIVADDTSIPSVELGVDGRWWSTSRMACVTIAGPLELEGVHQVFDGLNDAISAHHEKEPCQVSGKKGNCRWGTVPGGETLSVRYGPEMKVEWCRTLR